MQRLSAAHVWACGFRCFVLIPAFLHSARDCSGLLHHTWRKSRCTAQMHRVCSRTVCSLINHSPMTQQLLLRQAPRALAAPYNHLRRRETVHISINPSSNPSSIQPSHRQSETPPSSSIEFLAPSTLSQHRHLLHRPPWRSIASSTTRSNP